MDIPIKGAYTVKSMDDLLLATASYLLLIAITLWIKSLITSPNSPQQNEENVRRLF